MVKYKYTCIFENVYRIVNIYYQTYFLIIILYNRVFGQISQMYMTLTRPLEQRPLYNVILCKTYSPTYDSSSCFGTTKIDTTTDMLQSNFVLVNSIQMIFVHSRENYNIRIVQINDHF